MTLQISQKRIIMRRAWLAAVVLILSVLQNVGGWFPQIFGARALLLIPAVVAISMFEREIPGIFYGLFAGALWDIVSRGGNFNAIFFVIIGFACGSLISNIMRNNFITHFILSGAATVLYTLLYWLWHYVINNTDRSVFILFRYYLPTTIYTAVLAPFVFILVKTIEDRFRIDRYSGLS